MCPTKLLLVHALRHNLVEVFTLEEILEIAWARHDKTIQWTRPSLPVITACEKSFFSFLNFQKPVGIDQVESTVKQMSLGSGILAKIIPHDIRRGGARDLSHLSKDQVWGGVAHEGIAAALGHSLMSFKKGLTQEYVCPTNSDLNSLKAANPYDDPVAPIVGEGLTQPALRKEQIDEYCKSNSWNLSSRSHRDAASKRIRKAAVGCPHRPPKRQAQYRSSSFSFTLHVGAQETLRLTMMTMSSQSSNPFNGKGSVAKARKAGLKTAEDLSDKVAEAVVMDTVMGSAFRQSSQDVPLTKPGPEFVRWLSTINVSLNNTLSHAPKDDRRLPSKACAHGEFPRLPNVVQIQMSQGGRRLHVLQSRSLCDFQTYR